MNKLLRLMFVLAMLLSFAVPVTAAPQDIEGRPPDAASQIVEATILHTNDFHGYLEQDSSGRGGSAYVAGKVDEIRADKGADSVLLLDAGDIYFGGAPISALTLGESAIDIYNLMGYDVAAYGNHEFDKGQTVIISRTTQSNFPWVGANIVLEGTNWEHPAWVTPYVTLTVGSGADQAVVGIIGVDTDETPLVTLKGTTEGLVFEDLTEAILHYYDEVLTHADAVVVLAHMGSSDSGEFKGLETIAQELIDAGKPVSLMIGGHQHQALTEPIMVGDTSIVQAGYYGRYLGQVDISIDTTTHALDVVTYTLHTINSASGITASTVVSDRVAYWSNEVKDELEAPVGYTEIDLIRDYNSESSMGDLVADSMLWKADEYDDGEANGSVDIAFTNPGGLRADFQIPEGATTPYTVTWGDTFSVLPFGNTLFLMDLTGAQIQDLLDQSGKLYKGILQSAGISYYWYNDEAAFNRAPTAWGAYGVMVGGEPLELDKVYRVVTNNFLAGGQDGWVTFADGTNRWDTYYDMQLGLNEYIEEVLGGTITAESIKMQRIQQLDKVVTILHTNDVHGNFLASSYYGDPNGMVYMGALIDKERAHNPNALLLDAGDIFQGNSFAYFFKDATPNPIAGTLNMLDYDAIVLGNHEFNFGPQTLATAFGQLNFPILGSANLDDDGSYGFINDNVKDYITKTVDGLDVAIFGLTNPRVPRYELPTNIPGLTFHPATETVQSLVPSILDAEDPDLLIGLTHIGYSPYGDEKDSDVLVAQETSGIDVLVGAHSHTRLDPAVLITSTVNPTGTLVAQAYKYATYLGKVNVGFVGGEVVLREGYLIPATETMTHTALSEYLQPFSEQLDTFNDTEIGQTLVPLDALEAYTEETNGANLQVDASAWELEQHGVMVDFHLSGAMSNKRVADTASASNPVTLTKGDMFNLMPYENSLVALEMTGAQIKEILERSYRNYYNYKYVPGHGGYSYYTTCFLDINKGGEITYIESVPNGNNVYSLSMNGQEIDLTDDTVTYTVSTVNYVAAGSCNFNDNGETIWPLDQIVADTQRYVRDAVINYVDAQTAPIAPAVEDRLVFADSDLSTSTKTVVDASGNDIAEAGEVLTYTITLVNTGMNGAAVMLTDTLPTGVDYVTGTLSYGGLPADATVAMLDDVLTVRTQNFPDQPIGASFTINVPATIEFAVTVSDPVPEGETIENTIELRDQTLTYEIAPAVISLPTAGYKIFLPIIMRELTN